ncbi:PKD domain-containing protein [Aestuariivivens sediminicola]|uniref:PKD domain-containing protein n=1 Tax=Aestuariivivens sediminicola TaxID=2913560 RepID=UPI001F58F1EA|nr:PKD domain-containing protein [Aestuariivivens sediminicola]
MKRSLLDFFKKVCLIMALFLVHSCDEGATVEGPREKEFLSRVSAERAVVNDDITFTDLSLGAVSRSWVFEGGDPLSSSSPEVIVSFPEAGMKNCSLTVTFSDGSEETQNFSIEILPELVASFTYAETGANIPIQFTDTSEGDPDGWSWVFPGGSPATSTERNPVVTWPSEREITVSLTVSRSFDDITTSYAIPVSIGPPNLWTSEAQGFENPDSPFWWQTWLGGGGWPAGSLTTVAGGANDTENTARVAYPGGSTWNMITRDTRAHNAVIYKGKTYKISFYIKAQTATSIAFVRFSNQIPSWWPDAWKNGDPDQGFYSQGIYGINVTTDWQYHEAQFTLNDLPYDVGLNTFPDIELSGPVSPNVIFIDEVRLQQLD